LRDVEEQLFSKLPSLSDYGVTPQLLTEYKQAIDQYEKLMAAPRDTIVKRKTLNQGITEQVRTFRQLLFKMDHLVNNFEGTVFEQEYHHARIVADLGTRHKKAGGEDDKEVKTSDK